MKQKAEIKMFSGIENYERFSIAEIAAGALDDLIEMGEPITLHGGTGIGKTVICNPIADRLGRVFKYTQPAAHESSDFAGLPMHDKVSNTVKFIISEMIDFDPKKKYLWLIDELNRAMVDVRQVLLGLFNQPGYIGSHRIPDNVSIIVAVNSAAIQSGVTVGENEAAQMSRTANVYAYSTLTDTVSYLQKKYSESNLFTKFLQSDFARKIIAEDFSTEWEKSSDEILLVPRILEKAVKLTGKYGSVSNVQGHLRQIGAFIGQSAKNQFVQFLAECEALNPEEFFKKSSKVLTEVFNREKTSENSTLILTGATQAMNMLLDKGESEQINLLANVIKLFKLQWCEIVGAALHRLATLTESGHPKTHAFLQLITKPEYTEISHFFIDYRLKNKAKA